MSNTALSSLAILIGTWNTTGDVLATEDSPATTLSATDSYRWLAGGHFIVHEVDARFGGVPARSLEVIGNDDGRLIARSYNDQGTIEVSEFSLTEKTLRITGATVRFEGSFDAHGKVLAGLWETKRDHAWQPWIRLKLERAW